MGLLGILLINRTPVLSPVAHYQYFRSIGTGSLLENVPFLTVLCDIQTSDLFVLGYP